MSVGESGKGGTEESNTGTVGVGVLGLVIGVGAVILANLTKLTTEKALPGGAYIKDGYRNGLLVAGVVLTALSLILVVLAAITTVDQGVLRTIRNVTTILMIGTAIGGGLIYAGYRHEEDVLASTTGSGSSLGPPVPAPATPAPADTNPGDYGSPCAINLTGHDVVVAFTGSTAANDCASFVSAESRDGQWQTVSSANTSLPQVCDLAQRSDQVQVNDDGGQSYGTQACQLLQSEGWTASTTSTSSVPIATPSSPIEVDCPLDGTGTPENNNQPTSCSWIVGPGTGAEQNPPPNPEPGVIYQVDVGESCTWKDAGRDASGTAERFSCR